MEALRGEAALRSRLPKENNKRNAAITPCDKSMSEAHPFSAFPKESVEMENVLHPCIGDLMQHTRKGKILPRFQESILLNTKVKTNLGTNY